MSNFLKITNGEPRGAAIVAGDLPTITLTSDVTGSGSSGSIATTVAKIQGTTVSGTTGTGNVVFSTSPTITGSSFVTMVLSPPNTTTGIGIEFKNVASSGRYNYLIGNSVGVASNFEIIPSTATDGLTFTSGSGLSVDHSGNLTMNGNITANGGTISGTATNISATSNSTLTTLSALSLPGSQVTGTISGNAANITATSNSTLTTLSALSLPGSQVTGNISGNAANVTGTVTTAHGGTGLTSFNAHSVLIGTTGTAITQTAVGGSGTVFVGQGSSADPIFTAAPTLGVNGTTAGTIALANATSGGGSVTVQNLGTTSGNAYNFNLPTTAGTAGQALISQGGGSTSMSWGTIPTLTTLGIFSGKVAIGSGATTIGVTFSSSFGNTNYSVVGTMINTTDTNPAFIPVTVTAQSITGCTFTWNSPTPSANYSLFYQAIVNN